jgi:hypothetical protein
VPTPSRLRFLEPYLHDQGCHRVVGTLERLPVKEDHAAKMDGLKQTFEDERCFIRVHAGAASVGQEHGKRRCPHSRGTYIDFPLKPAVRLPRVDLRSYSTSSPCRHSNWQPCTTCDDPHASKLRQPRQHWVMAAFVRYSEWLRAISKVLKTSSQA